MDEIDQQHAVRDKLYYWTRRRWGMDDLQLQRCLGTGICQCGRLGREFDEGRRDREFCFLIKSLML